MLCAVFGHHHCRKLMRVKYKFYEWRERMDGDAPRVLQWR
jgi:hypothetical protein